MDDVIFAIGEFIWLMEVLPAPSNVHLLQRRLVLDHHNLFIAFLSLFAIVGLGMK
jgi:hypothetical protein